MLPLLTRLQCVTQQLSSSSLLTVAAACSSSSSSSLLATLWHQQQQQHQHQQKHAGLISTSAAASAVPAAARSPPASAEPCILTHRVPSRAESRSSSSSRAVRYPYPLPPQYAPRKLQLQDLDGQPLGAVELPGDVFNVPVRIDILHQVVRWQRAKARQGTHKTKDRSEVSGGGRKPWQQKGLGRARQGSIRAPQWRGGGIVHGPVPRSHAFKLPRKVRRLGLKCALSAKANEGRLLLLDNLQPNQPKTKVMAGKLQHLLDQAAAAAAVAGSGSGIEQGLTHLLLRYSAQQGSAKQPPALQEGLAGVLNPGSVRLSAVLMDTAKDGDDGGESMRRAARNIPGVEVLPVAGANVLSLLRRDVLILTKPALDALIERLQRPINRLGASGLAYQRKLAERRAEAARQQRLAAAVAGDTDRQRL